MPSARHATWFAVCCAWCLLSLPGPGQDLRPGVYSLAKAQSMVDFLVYVPRYLPPRCQVGDALVIPERGAGNERVPAQVYLRLGRDLALWEMPYVPEAPPNRVEAVRRLGDTRAWVIRPGAGGYRTIMWTHAGTQFGLTGKYPLSTLLRVAASIVLAAPDVIPRRLSRPALPPGGIGAVLWLFGEHFIDEVAEGMPAHAAGLRPGDEILAVDGRPVRDLEPGEIVRRVRGRIGSKVTITVRRGGSVFSRTLVRARVPEVVTVRRPLEEAVKAASFRVFRPKWLPEGFRLSEVAVSTLRPDPRREGQQVEMMYARSGPHLSTTGRLFITQKKATGAEAPYARRYVRVGKASAALYVGPRGGFSLRWKVGGTQITMRSSGVAFGDLVKVATSME